jgi:hypothetical protein
MRKLALALYHVVTSQQAFDARQLFAAASKKQPSARRKARATSSAKAAHPAASQAASKTGKATKARCLR